MRSRALESKGVYNAVLALRGQGIRVYREGSGKHTVIVSGGKVRSGLLHTDLSWLAFGTNEPGRAGFDEVRERVTWKE